MSVVTLHALLLASLQSSMLFLLVFFVNPRGWRVGLDSCTIFPGCRVSSFTKTATECEKKSQASGELCFERIFGVQDLKLSKMSRLDCWDIWESGISLATVTLYNTILTSDLSGWPWSEVILTQKWSCFVTKKKMTCRILHLLHIFLYQVPTLSIVISPSSRCQLKGRSYSPTLGRMAQPQCHTPPLWFGKIDSQMPSSIRSGYKRKCNGSANGWKYGVAVGKPTDFVLGRSAGKPGSCPSDFAEVRHLPQPASSRRIWMQEQHLQAATHVILFEGVNSWA